jgi:hypothetical protein
MYPFYGFDCAPWFIHNEPGQDRRLKGLVAVAMEDETAIASNIQGDPLPNQTC